MDEFEIIPSEQWQAFCESFSRTHRGWLVRLWVVDTVNLEAGLDQTSDALIRDLTLWEIVTEQHERHTDVSILVRNGNARVDHMVGDVASISLERDADDKVSGLRIDGANGKTSLLRFRVPARPEDVDGLAPGDMP